MKKFVAITLAAVIYLLPSLSSAGCATCGQTTRVHRTYYAAYDYPAPAPCYAARPVCAPVCQPVCRPACSPCGSCFNPLGFVGGVINGVGCAVSGIGCAVSNVFNPCGPCY